MIFFLYYASESDVCNSFWLQAFVLFLQEIVSWVSYK